jgi:SAM-dependent methyltransferase
MQKAEKDMGQNFRRAVAIVVLAWVFVLAGWVGAVSPLRADSIYQTRPLHNLDGTGKFYQGREIAPVMGHLGAGWLERPTRELEEQPQRLIDSLNLQPTAIVADIGAGTGYFSLRIARRFPQGKVFAVDVQPEMVDLLRATAEQEHITNVEPTLGSPTDPHLPAGSVDLALLVDAYHEFEFPFEMMQGLVRALKPEGRVMLVEYRGENPFVPIKPLHKMTQKQVKKEMAAVGLVWLETQNFLPQQHVMVFGKAKTTVSESSLLSVM